MKPGKELGVGNTATVYEWGQGKVIKLFHYNYPRKSIEKEFQSARIIANMDFEKPKMHKIVVYGKRIGIIYDKIEGKSLQNWVLETGDVKGCALYMANLYRKIISNRVSNIPSYKKFLRYYIVRIIDLEDREKILSILNELPDGDMLCHGDFHPGNIFISGASKDKWILTDPHNEKTQLFKMSWIPIIRYEVVKYKNSPGDASLKECFQKKIKKNL